MLINLRNALMTGRRLPYDAEVEFLESTGTQWIDTGVYGSDLVTARSSWSYRDAQSDAIPFGSRTSAQSEAFAITGYSFLATKDLYFNFSTNGGYLRYYGSDVYASKWECFAGQGGSWLKKDGVTVYSNSASVTSFTTEKPILLFGLWNGNNLRMSDGVRIEAFSLYNNNSLVRDFIPVRKGTVGYMYDRVSGKLFGNAGTGDFVLGPDVVPVEYIESHGTEWIDTGVLIEMTDRVDCTFELLAYGNATLAGGRVGPSTSSWAMWAYTNNERCIRFDLLDDSHGSVVASIAPTLGQEYKVSKIGERNFVDGVEVQSNTSVAYTPSRPCYLFAMNNGGTASFIVNCRIKDFSIGSKLKYRPVRVGTDATSWEGAMMDTLTRRIYRNQGTGAFTYGNDLKYPIPSE